MSIKPSFVESILDGKKRYEYRRQKPSRDVDHIIIYATREKKENSFSNVKSGYVVAEADVEEILENCPEKMWKETHSFSGIDKDFFYSYFKGKAISFAYKLVNIKKCEKPKLLSDFGLRIAPQSFCYIS